MHGSAAEWNVSIKGHNPLTCSPVFAAVLEKDGESGLRLYEFERKREIVYSLDVWLPKGAEFLLVHTRISRHGSFGTKCHAGKCTFNVEGFFEKKIIR